MDFGDREVLSPLKYALGRARDKKGGDARGRAESCTAPEPVSMKGGGGLTWGEETAELKTSMSCMWRPCILEECLWVPPNLFHFH